MNPTQFLDTFGTPIFICLFAALFAWQWRRPLRAQHFSMLRRLARNFIFSAPGFLVLRFALIPIPFGVAVWAGQHGIGLLHWLPLPVWAAGVAGFLLMDWAYYWLHFGMHALPVCWRFHNIHHTDLDMDLSTAARFHFGEIILSIPFRIAAVALIGISPLTYLVFEIVFESASLFHHSNSRLPLAVERALNRVIVTPRMHGIHHSIVKRETDSNWGTIFCWWDALHRTLRRDIPQDALTIGVAAFRDERELTIGRLWKLPFQKQRDWRLPSGETPERTPQPAERLAP